MENVVGIRRLGCLYPGCGTSPAQAVSYYWDIDGATAGAGGATPLSVAATVANHADKPLKQA